MLHCCEVDLVLCGTATVERGILALAVDLAGLGEGLEVLTAALLRLRESCLDRLDLRDTTGLDRWRDEALNAWSLYARLLSLLLHLAANNKAADVVLTPEVEQLADFARALGAQAAGVGNVSDALDGGCTYLGDDDIEARNIRPNNAPANALLAALTWAATECTEANGATLQQQRHTAGCQDTLNHGESLLVLTTLEVEGVPSELWPEQRTIDFVAKAVVVDVGLAQRVVTDVELLDGSVARISDVDLHRAHTTYNVKHERLWNETTNTTQIPSEDRRLTTYASSPPSFAAIKND